MPTLLKLAAPNLVQLLVQSSIGLIEAYWVGRLGTGALAGVALVFPALMLMQMMSAGAMGGGISSAIARAIGAKRNADANALVIHALLIAVALGLTFSVAMLAGGRALYTLMGGRDAVLDAALTYSNVLFAGIVLLWVFNALASVLRGTGNMALPAIVTAAGARARHSTVAAVDIRVGTVSALGSRGRGDGGAALLRQARFRFSRMPYGRAATSCSRCCAERKSAGHSCMKFSAWAWWPRQLRSRPT